MATREELEWELSVAQSRNNTLKAEVADLENQLSTLQVEYDSMDYRNELDHIESDLTHNVLGE